jgi:DUF4097 and DUF4098 domain-containing protein YvlB
MRIKRKLDMDRYETMLRDLEVMKNNDEISDETYAEMKAKYEEKLNNLEEEYFETEDEITLEFNELGEIIEERVEDAVSRAMDTIKKMSVKIPSWDLGNQPVKEEIFEGSFESDTVKITFSTENGQIELKKWDEDTYKVVVTMKPSGVHRGTQEHDLDIRFEHKKNGQEELIFTADETRDIVNVKAYLPPAPKGIFSSLKKDHMTYLLDLESTNGRISVTGLKVKDSDVQTENGRIGMETIEADTLHVSTENGRILMETVSGDDLSLSTENGSIDLIEIKSQTLTASTENGSIRAHLSCERADLDTENGSIRLTPHSRGTYTAKTEMGSVAIDVDRTIPHAIEARVEKGTVKVSSDLTIDHYGNHSTIIKSSDYVEGEGISITAHTSMGRIKIK